MWRRGAFRNWGDGPVRPPGREGNGAGAGGALGAGPLVELVEEAAGLRPRLGRAHAADDTTPGDRPGKHGEPRVAERRRDVVDHERIAQVRLVAAVLRHRLVERDPGERRPRRAEEDTSELQSQPKL